MLATQNMNLEELRIQEKLAVLRKKWEKTHDLIMRSVIEKQGKLLKKALKKIEEKRAV